MSKKVNHSSDIYNGDPIKLAFGNDNPPLNLLSFNTNPEYLEFFQSRVQAFVRQVKFIESTSLGSSSTLVIGGLFMGMAAAMNDPVSIRAIAESMPHATQVFLDAKRMGQKIGPDQSCSESLTPFAVAMLYGSLDAMKALTDLGWSPDQAVCVRYDERKDPSQKPAPRQRFNAIEWIKFECDREGLFTFPSVIEWAILKSCPFSGPSSIQESVEHLVVDTIKNRQMDAILPALSRSGALKTIPNSFILTAIDNLNWAAVDAILPHVEWQKLTDELEKLDPAFATEALLCSIMNNFPPVQLAIRLKLSKVRTADADNHVFKLFQACINSGSGSLLAFSGCTNSPLRVMASNGLPRSMLLCLEQGADHNVKFLENIPTSASFTAEQMAYENEPTAKVMRSFIALREANQAIRDIRSSIA